MGGGSVHAGTSASVTVSCSGGGCPKPEALQWYQQRLRTDAPGEPGKRSRVVGLAELPGRRFIYSLFDADQFWIADLSQPGAPRLAKFRNVGRQPYDGFVTPNGRHYIAGLFGEDGLALVDLWNPDKGARRGLDG